MPEDRLGTGVAPSLSIASNVVLKSYRKPPASRGPLLLLRKIRELAETLMQRYDVRASGPDVPAGQLSGGNLQKVVLAREFDGEPRVLVVAAPTQTASAHAAASALGAGPVSAQLVAPQSPAAAFSRPNPKLSSRAAPSKAMIWRQKKSGLRDLLLVFKDAPSPCLDSDGLRRRAIAPPARLRYSAAQGSGENV